MYGGLLTQIDKDLNTFSMRVKEWYSWHFPELKDIVKDNTLYARVVKLIQSRKFLEDDSCVSALQQVVLDEDVARDIMNAGRASMGQELNQMDLVSVNLFADK
jgi:singapore isolate B (sub-type 7) whole genome shotgun sequence assembly, scaffold_5